MFMLTRFEGDFRNGHPFAGELDEHLQVVGDAERIEVNFRDSIFATEGFRNPKIFQFLNFLSSVLTDERNGGQFSDSDIGLFRHQIKLQRFESESFGELEFNLDRSE